MCLQACLCLQHLWLYVVIRMDYCHNSDAWIFQSVCCVSTPPQLSLLMISKRQLMESSLLSSAPAFFEIYYTCFIPKVWPKKLFKSKWETKVQHILAASCYVTLTDAHSTYWPTNWCFSGELTRHDATNVWAFIQNNKLQWFNVYFGIYRSPQRPADTWLTSHSHKRCWWSAWRSSTIGGKGLIPTYGGKPHKLPQGWIITSVKQAQLKLFGVRIRKLVSVALYLYLRAKSTAVLSSRFLMSAKHVCERWWICNSMKNLLRSAGCNDFLISQ